MSPLDKQLSAAARRMRNVRFAQLLSKTAACAVAALIVFTIVDKSGLLASHLRTDWMGAGIWRDGAFTLPALLVPTVYFNVLLILIGCGILMAAVLIRQESFSRNRAALAIDRRLALQERVTSAAAMGESELPLAKALLEDASRHCAPINVARLFPYAAGAAGPKWPWLLAGLAAVVLLLPDMDLLGVRAARHEEKTKQVKARKHVNALADTLQKQAKEIRKELKKRGIQKQTLDELTRKMEELAKKMKHERAIDEKKAKEMINRLQEKIQKDMEAEALKANNLKQIKPFRSKRSLLRKTAEKMRDNDFKGAAGEIERLRRRLTRNKMKPEELKRLSKEMKDLAKQMEGTKLHKLQKSFEEMAKDLEDLQNSKNMEKLAKLQEKLAEQLKSLQDSKKLDLSKLTKEERELLQKLQQMAAKMEMTEKMMQDMQQAAEEGKMRMITQEDLKKMLEAMKNTQFCPECGEPGWDGKDHSGGKAGQGKDGKGGKDGEGKGGTGGKDGKEKGGEDGKDGDGVCPVCGRKHGQGKKGGGGLMGIPGMGMRPSGRKPGQGSGAGMKGAGQGTGGKAPERDSDSDFEDSRIRARAVTPGQIIGIQFVRGMPPGEAKPKAEYTEAVEAMESSEDSIREKEVIPREDRELIRQYHNRIKGIESTEDEK